MHGAKRVETWERVSRTEGYKIPAHAHVLLARHDNLFIILFARTTLLLLVTKNKKQNIKRKKKHILVEIEAMLCYPGNQIQLHEFHSSKIYHCLVRLYISNFSFFFFEIGNILINTFFGNMTIEKILSKAIFVYILDNFFCMFGVIWKFFLY